MFTTLQLEDLPLTIFEELSACTQLEAVGRGRFAAKIFNSDDNKIPLVRTTSSYEQPSQRMTPLHLRIIDQINKQLNVSPPLVLNNALVEIYRGTYDTMKFHSDQALDLQEDSSIVIFTCTNNPESKTPPRLHVRDKAHPVGPIIKIGWGHSYVDNLFEEKVFPFNHCAAIVFSTQTNASHIHTIYQKCTENEQWLYITFRTARTFIEFKEHIPYFVNCWLAPDRLHLADKSERQQFYQNKSNENNRTAFNPASVKIKFTVSKGD